MPSNLFVPIFFWHGYPLHDVTCTALSSDGKKLTTGSENGMICIWSFRQEEVSTIDKRK